MNHNMQIGGNAPQVRNKAFLASSLAFLALASEGRGIPPPSSLSSATPEEGVADSMCESTLLSNAGLAVVDDDDIVPLRPALLAAATALSKRPLLGRLFPREAVDVDDVDVAADADVEAPAVRFTIGPTTAAATLS